MKLVSMFRHGIPALVAMGAMACSGAEPEESSDGKLSGTLVKAIVHENSGKSRGEYYLSVNKRWTRLVVDESKIDPTTINHQVHIVGRPSADGQRIDVDRIERPSSASTGKLQQELSTQAPKGKVAVILVRDSRLPAVDAYPKQAARDQLFDSATSTNNYFKEASYGAYGLSGDVYGWVTTDMSDCGNTQPWQQEAGAKAAQLGFVTDNYRHAIFVYDRLGGGDGCFYARGSFGSPDGIGTIESFHDSAGTFAHEIGHNLGLDHGTLLSCQNSHFEYVSYAAQCEDQVYNDPFDAMGYDGFYYHYNSYSKQLQGWLPESNVAHVTQAGSFTIVPQETAAEALQSLLIPIPNSNDSFHVEMRKQYGFDKEPRFDGAVLVRRVSQSGLYQYTHLIDMTPDNDPGNASLAVGQTFQDEVTGISITLQSRSSTQAVVSVDFGAPNCSDGVQNNSESDVDCGGLCNPCQEGQACNAQRECYTGVCGDGTCVVNDTGGLTAEYYAGLDFAELKFTRTDRFIDFNWHDQSPDYRIPVNQFSVRWSATLQAPKSGTYSFKATTDDGVRLWIGDQLVIDRWYGAEETVGQVDLTAGESYDFKMEYFEDGGDARARLLWAPPGEAYDLISPVLLTPVGCSLATAVDIGPRTTTTSVTSDACLKLTQFPSWWQFTSGAVTLQSGTGSFPVPFTWQDSCDQSGSATFSSAYQSVPVGNHTQSCPLLIDLNGDGSPLQLSWF